MASTWPFRYISRASQQGVPPMQERTKTRGVPRHPPRASNPHNFSGPPQKRFLVENCACPNLDAMSVQEALVYSILHHFVQLSRIKHP